MIELAPHHKFGLPVNSPILPAAGVFGYGEEYYDQIPYAALGAIVTNPVAVRPRHVARGQRVARHGEHLVVHTGLPGPGLPKILKTYRKVWERLPIPVIVHSIAHSVSEAAEIARQLSGVTGVLGIELGLDEGVRRDEALALLAAMRGGGDLPVIVRAPFGQASLAMSLADAGADAVTLTAPPRAVLPLGSDDHVARYMRGRLYGPALFPLLLHQLALWARKIPAPVIACGGISTPEEAQACLDLGATAVQVDAVVWRSPGVIRQMAVALRVPGVEAD